MVVKVTKVKNHTETDFEFTLENFEKEISNLKKDYKINNITNIEDLLIEKIKLFHYLEEKKDEIPLVMKDLNKKEMVIMLAGKDKDIISYFIKNIDNDW